MLTYPINRPLEHELACSRAEQFLVELNAASESRYYILDIFLTPNNDDKQVYLVRNYFLNLNYTGAHLLSAIKRNISILLKDKRDSEDPLNLNNFVFENIVFEYTLLKHKDFILKRTKAKLIAFQQLFNRLLINPKKVN